METQIRKPGEEPSVLAYAFLGDSVYELFMRSQLLDTSLRKASQLSKAASQLACAAKQAELSYLLEPMLSEEELSMLKRGRNSRTRHAPRGDTLDYRQATGLETLLGWHYYHHRHERLHDILELLWCLAYREDAEPESATGDDADRKTPLYPLA